MADITKRAPGCDDDEGERGPRGRRGHRGPPGPAATAPRSLLKFSGAGFSSIEEGPTTVYLPDVGTIGTAVSGPVQYPVAVDCSFRNFAVNLQPFFRPLDSTVTVQLLKNGVPVPGFSVTYAGASSGIRGIVAGPVAFAGAPSPDTFDVQVTASGFDGTFFVSATVGVE